MNKIKYLAVIVLVLCAASAVFIKHSALCRSNTSDITSSPRLAYPINPEVTVTGESLEFKWWPGEIGISEYHFTLYKGGGPFGDIVADKKVFSNVSSVAVDANLLEDGQVYTWTLRQRADDGIWGDMSSNTFKVIKQK